MSSKNCFSPASVGVEVYSNQKNSVAIPLTTPSLYVSLSFCLFLILRSETVKRRKRDGREESLVDTVIVLAYDIVFAANKQEKSIA